MLTTRSSLALTAMLTLASFAATAQEATEAAVSVDAQVAAVAPTASAAVDISLPDLKATEWFDGKMGGTFGAKTVTAFAKTNRVAVAGFRVVFVTHNEARAISRASYLPGGVETGTAKAKMEVDLQGVDDATLQAITDKAYADFLAQLKAAGRELVPSDQMQAAWANFKATAAPQAVSQGLLKGKAFAPTGMPLWWQVGEVWGDAGLGQKNMRALNELSQSLGAPLTIAPQIVVDFAQMQSSGNRSSLLQREASVGASLAMSVPTFTSRVVRAEETRYGGIVFKGDDGALNMTQRLDTDIQFADMVKVETNDKGSLMDLKMFGILGSNSKNAINAARTTNEAYSLAAQTVLNKTTGTFAKLFAEYPAAQ